MGKLAVHNVPNSAVHVPQEQPRGAAEPLDLSWQHPDGLVGLSLANYCLRFLTLGIYHFWGKTEVRRRVWSAIRLNGEPLEYTGTGRELLIGFLLVFGIVLLPVMLLSVGAVLAFGPNSTAFGVFQVLLYATFFFLAGVGFYRAQRYRMNRTRWRGIRAGLDDASWSYGWTHLWTAALIPLTLGWIMPWRATRLQGLVTNRMWFGTKPLQFSASSGPLYARFTVLWVGAILILAATGVSINRIAALAVAQQQQRSPIAAPDPTQVAATIGVLAVAYLLLGIVSAWYRARQINHFAAHTHFNGATFRGNASAGSLIWLGLSNFLILLLGFLIVLAFVIVLTAIAFSVLYVAGVRLQPGVAATPGTITALSLAPMLIGLVVGTGFVLFAPVTQARSTRYLVERLSIEGLVPLADIAQGADAGITRGEGLAQAFDIDAF